MAETVYRLRQLGWTNQEIAHKTGKKLHHVMQIAQRELNYQCKALKYPFIEYIGPRTEKVIKKCLGESILAEPEKLSEIEKLKTLICLPGVSDGVMRNLAEGLAEAGYESFDVEQIKDAIFTTKRMAQRMRRERFGV